MTAFLQGRIALLAVLLAACLAAADAAAQSDRDVIRGLSARIESADERLMDTVEKKLLDGVPVGRDEVQTLFVRGFEYFRARDYFTASRLFSRGLGAWNDMGWPKNDTYARAHYYRLLAEKRFCIDDEADKCAAFYRSSRYTTYLEWVGSIQQLLSYAEAFPAELRAEAKRECRGALEKLGALCRADGSGSETCRKKRSC